MKLDIEGSELEVIPDLLLSGALKNVDKIYVEWHVAHMATGEKKKQEEMVNCLEKIRT